MPIFRKCFVPELLSETNRLALQRCRSVLEKDLEVRRIIHYISADDGFKAGAYNQILVAPTREERASLFLDRLETRGDSAFGMFMEALKFQYKHLFHLMSDIIREYNCRDVIGTTGNSTECHVGKTVMSGELVRKMLSDRISNAGMTSNYEDSATEDDEMLDRSTYAEGGVDADDDEEEDGDEEAEHYLDCYSLTLRGFEQERWIKHECGSHVVADTPEMVNGKSEVSTWTGTLLKNLNFKLLDVERSSDLLKQLPTNCPTYIVDVELQTDRRQPTPMMGSSNHPTPMMGSSNHPNPMMGSSNHPTPMMGSSKHPNSMMGSSNHPTPMMGSSNYPTPMMGSSNHPALMMGSSKHPTQMMGSSISYCEQDWKNKFDPSDAFPRKFNFLRSNTVEEFSSDSLPPPIPPKPDYLPSGEHLFKRPMFRTKATIQSSINMPCVKILEVGSTKDDPAPGAKDEPASPWCSRDSDTARILACQGATTDGTEN